MKFDVLSLDNGCFGAKLPRVCPCTSKHLEPLASESLSASSASADLQLAVYLQQTILFIYSTQYGKPFES